MKCFAALLKCLPNLFYNKDTVAKLLQTCVLDVLNYGSEDRKMLFEAAEDEDVSEGFPEDGQNGDGVDDYGDGVGEGQPPKKKLKRESEKAILKAQYSGHSAETLRRQILQKNAFADRFLPAAVAAYMRFWAEEIGEKLLPPGTVSLAKSSDTSGGFMDVSQLVALDEVCLRILWMGMVGKVENPAAFLSTGGSSQRGSSSQSQRQCRRGQKGSKKRSRGNFAETPTIEERASAEIRTSALFTAQHVETLLYNSPAVCIAIMEYLYGKLPKCGENAGPWNNSLSFAQPFLGVLEVLGRKHHNGHVRETATNLRAANSTRRRKSN